jgi:hypothetical protein
MKALLQRWSIMRILRLVLGIAILVQGIITGDSLSVILGVIFSGTAFANIGCCATGSCAVDPGSSDRKNDSK